MYADIYLLVLFFVASGIWKLQLWKPGISFVYMMYEKW